MGDDLAWGDDLFRDTGHASDPRMRTPRFASDSIAISGHNRGIRSANVKRALKLWRSGCALGPESAILPVEHD